MRTAIWFIYFWCYLVAVLPLMFRCKRLTAQGRVAESDAKMKKAVRNWARRLLKLAGVQVEISGQENVPEGPVVYVGNHQGNFDIPLMLAYLREPCGVLAKEELAKIPMIKTWMKLLHCVFVERGNPKQSVAALKEAGGLLRQGYSMVIFPEGTRSRGDQVGPFKTGAFRVASMTGTPIVPLCIDGSYRVMEANGFWIRPAKVRIRLLPRIETKGLSREEVHGLDERVRQIIVEEKAKLA